jgi:hypothetical protein
LSLKKEKKKWVVDTNTNRERKWGRGKILKEESNDNETQTIKEGKHLRKQ